MGKAARNRAHIYVQWRICISFGPGLLLGLAWAAGMNECGTGEKWAARAAGVEFCRLWQNRRRAGTVRKLGLFLT